jgi:hypothetical protein
VVKRPETQFARELLDECLGQLAILVSFNRGYEPSSMKAGYLRRGTTTGTFRQQQIRGRLLCIVTEQRTQKLNEGGLSVGSRPASHEQKVLRSVAGEGVPDRSLDEVPQVL